MRQDCARQQCRHGGYKESLPTAVLQCPLLSWRRILRLIESTLTLFARRGPGCMDWIEGMVGSRWSTIACGTEAFGRPPSLGPVARRMAACMSLHYDP